MPITDYPYNLLQGLSDFWTRFFADADQLEAMYRGTAVLIGQAYLDLMSAVLGVSLRDALALDKEYFRLVTIREDEVRFAAGASSPDDRWVFDLPDPVVSFTSLDNRVVEPTVTLQERIDYDATPRQVRFRQDPTDPAGDGIPLAGYARRGLDVEVGGTFDDADRATGGPLWTARGVKKGDVLRLLDLGPTAPEQRRRNDLSIVLVRPTFIAVSTKTPLPGAAVNQAYVVLRAPADAQVLFEHVTYVSGAATLAHGRLDFGSVIVYAKGPSGADVVEGVDYNVDYELGKIYQLTVWSVSSDVVSYSWKVEVWPTAGPPPHYSTTGIAVSGPTTTQVVQMAAWAPDARVDRRTLSNNFGVMIGREADSSEVYRAFLEGIFQLYILGPVLERVESALNVVLGLPVVRDDGEVITEIDTSPTDVNVVHTRRLAGPPGTYTYPKVAPLRTDLVVGLVVNAFDALTTAVSVTDYVRDDTWWHDTVIPPALFSPVGGQIPNIVRRTSSPAYVEHVIGAPDQPQIGDPGLIIGADETGFQPPPGHPIYRHRMAYVLMDRYLKFHTFVVKFDPSILSIGPSARFAQGLDDLNALVLSSRPAHTYPFTQPSTFFVDRVLVSDEDGKLYQPQRYVGANPDAVEIYDNVGQLPDPGQPYVVLGLSTSWIVGGGINGPDQVVFADAYPVIGTNGWTIGDYAHYELTLDTESFPSTGVPVALAGAPAAPRRRRLIEVRVGSTISGKALVENVDYSVDYAGATVTRLTAWDVTAAIVITFIQLNIGNTTAGPPDQTVGDVPLLIGGVDPALVTADFDPVAAGWDGVANPPSVPRDIGLVERALNITVLPFP